MSGQVSFRADFHGGNADSNPAGDATSFQPLIRNGQISDRHKKAQRGRRPCLVWSSSASIRPNAQSLAVLDARKSPMTLLWALRLSGVTAWVYVSSVTLLEASRSSSCTTLMSALVALSSDEYVWRKVCQPIFCVIPTFTAAGRINLRRMHWPQYGRRPPVSGLANTQSSGALYRVYRRHKALPPRCTLANPNRRFCPRLNW